MKKNTKLIIAGVIAVAAITVIAGTVFMARQLIIIDKDNHSLQIVGSKNGPITLFGAGKIPSDKNQNNYTSISMEEAKEIFANPGDYIILDVRTPSEYANGHIPGAINVANESIVDERPAELPDLNQEIYVYCRTGHRSKLASAKLAELGYTNIIEFGGILDWDGETEK